MTTAPLSLGSVARSAVCAARHATVRWDDPAGCLLVRLEPGSPVAQAIAAHPVLTVVVPAADPWTAVSVDGVAHRVPTAAYFAAVAREVAGR